MKNDDSRFPAAPEAILAAMQDIAYVKDKNGIIRGCSPAFAAAVGLPPESIPGLSEQDLFCDGMLVENAAEDREVLETGRMLRCSRWMKRPDGRKTVFDIQKSPLLGPNGETTGLLGVCHDITYQCEADERARASAMNFESFFAAIDEMAVVASLSGAILYINPAVTRRLGYTMEDLATAHVLDLNPADKREEAVRIFEDMMAGKRSTCPLPVVARDGSLVPAETRVWFGRWDGEVSLFSLVKDLSKEQELLQKFDKVFDLNPALMALSNIGDRTFRDVNQAFLRVLGYERDDVVGHTAAELGLFVESEKQQAIVNELIATGRVSDRALQVRRKNGEILDGLFSGELIESQGFPFMLTVMTDITQVRQIEHALREQTEFQQILMNIANRYIGLPLSAEDLTISQSLREIGQFVQADRAYVFDYEEASEAAVCTSLWSGEGVPAQDPADARVSFSLLGDWVRRHRNGEIVYIPDVAALPEQDRHKQRFQVRQVRSVITLPVLLDGACLGFVGFEFLRESRALDPAKLSLLNLFTQFLANFRSRKDKEEQLLLAKEQAEAGSRAKSRFLANMSHEIRTPMNGMLGYLQLMAERETDPEQTRCISKIRESAQTLLTVINDILDMSKIEAGKLHLESIEFSLPELVESVVNLFYLRSLEKGVGLEVELAPALPDILIGDPVRIRQVLGNLLSNAIKFTASGSIHVRVSCRGISQTCEEVLFEVMDTGVGISPDAARRIFEPFTQADNSSTRKFGGTGLGLSICKDLVRMMGGTLGVTSDPGKGSVFHFTVPCSCPLAAQKPAPTDERTLPAAPMTDERTLPAGRGAAGVRILLVEDNEINREVAMAILNRAGIAVTPVENGLEAINQMAAQMEVQMAAGPAEAGTGSPACPISPASSAGPGSPFDLVLMDIHMPVMDGYEATRRLRAALGEHCPPIVAMTAGVMNEERELAAAAGMVDYIVKPIEISQMLATIYRCLER